MVTAQPLFENVLIQPILKKKETKSGILLPDNKEQNDIIEGTIVSVGSGDTLPVAVSGIGGMSTLAHKAVVVKQGQHVVFKQYAATKIKVENENYYLVNQRDLLAVIQYT